MARVVRQKGMALITVVWALAIIAVIVAAFFSGTLLEARYWQDGNNEAQARALAEAGLHAFLGSFLQYAEAADTGESPWLIGNGEEAAPPLGTVDLQVDDLGSRLNLNLASEAELKAAFPGRDALIDAILDWRDRDDERRANGAEEADYRDLRPPVAPANNFFTCPEEVSLVKGAAEEAELLAAETTVYGRGNPNLIDQETWEAILLAAGFDGLALDWYSEDFRTYRQSYTAPGPFFRTFEDLSRLNHLAASVTSIKQQLQPFLTFQGRVNPNLASEAALRAALADLRLQPDKAGSLIEARREGRWFQDLETLRAFLNRGLAKAIVLDSLKQVFTLQTTLVQVTVDARTNLGASYRLKAVVERFHPQNEPKRWAYRILSWREEANPEIAQGAPAEDTAVVP